MPAKLLWAEGLFLRPQHFQQQDRYHEARLNQTARALHPYAWGVRRLELDDEALQRDTLRIEALSLVFPDGELYRAPEADPLPLQFKLASVAPGVQSITIHAALPALKAHGENCSTQEAPDAARRYVAHERDTQDLYTQAADARLTYLGKTLRLVADDMLPADCDSLPLLRLRRRASGGFERDPDFIAPSLCIDAAAGLQQALARLLEKLLAKVHALYRHLREPRRNVVDLRGGDMSAFWLLHTASTGYASLAHYQQHPALHPERLFADLLALCGSLLAYSRSYQLEDLPAYEHADPGPGFARIDSMLRELLDTVVSNRYFSVLLTNPRPGYYLGALDAARISAETTLYLAVAADMPALQLIELVPLRFKLGAPQDVEQFVLSALPGVTLMHTPQVPTALPVRPDTHYFALEQRGQLYQNMLKAQSISIFVPNGIRELRLSLIGVAA